MLKVEKRLSFNEKLCYGVGDAASNLFWMTCIYFLLYFYTDVFGISAAAAGAMMLYTRLFDTANDPIMGMVADRTTSRWGKFRPYILFGAVPFAIAGMLVFTTPDLSDTGKLVYAYITYSLFLLTYTIVNVPYSSLMGVISSDPVERTSFSAFRFTFAYLGGIFVQSLTLPMVKYIGDRSSEATGYQLTVSIYAVLAMILFFITFAGTRERVKTPKSQTSDPRKELIDLAKNVPFIILFFILLALFISDPSLKYGIPLAAAIGLIVFLVKRLQRHPDKVSNSQKDIIELVTNGPWLIVSVVGVMTLLWVSIKNAATIYYFKYFIKGGMYIPFIGDISNEILTTVFIVAGTVTTLLGVMSTKLLVSWFGKVRLYIGLMFVNATLIGVVYFLKPEDINIIFTMHVCGSFLGGPTAPIVFSMYADTADYSEWKHGRRATGLVFSAAGFAQKMGWTIGGALAGILLGYYGFEANMEQSEETLHGIRMLVATIPAIVAFLSGVIMFFYRLDDRTMKQIERDLEIRKSTA
ncbi:MAG: MFS transporter [Gammaproteobacteria bacterium]|nr:MFS transporter [Gammaproteobacteria bacterium]